MTFDFRQFELDSNFYDEIFSADHSVRSSYQMILPFFENLTTETLEGLDQEVKQIFMDQGITFNVYSDSQKGTERIFPFDLMPRVLPSEEWTHIESGLTQRNKAINLFLYDIYHDKEILKAGLVPAELVFSSSFYNHFMIGFTPPGQIYTHICGTDLIRHSDGKFYVLEDSVRCPSGVSYVLTNREALKKSLYSVLIDYRVKPVNNYTNELLLMMQSVAPEGVTYPNCVVLSPGIYNSAYFEHSFLAQNMGIPLIEGRDLVVIKNEVFMKTIRGLQKVDVIYRRIDDDFLDPLVYRPDSYIGVPGIMHAYLAGKVSLVNAPGTGLADDKAIYQYMPEIIRYYLQEEPILQNVKTYRCEVPEDKQFVLDNMTNLVVKPVDESGGYGVMIGSKASPKEIENYKKTIAQNPRKYIAQPIMQLSVHGTYIEADRQFEQRHIDLRSFSLMGKDRSFVLKGGLTRVALTKGSLIVNSSQGGGSKDTWVLEN